MSLVMHASSPSAWVGQQPLLLHQVFVDMGGYHRELFFTWLSSWCAVQLNDKAQDSLGLCA